VALRECAVHPRWKPERAAEEKRRRTGKEDRAIKWKPLV